MIDFAIIGAGIAGASLAYELADHGRVVVFEMEDQPGYHATGRSASFWDECYGGPQVQPLTRDSYDFLTAPPADFCDHGFLGQRGVLYLGQEEDRPNFVTMAEEFAGQVSLEHLGRAEIIDRVPGTLPGWSLGLFAQDCSDIDVAALHAAYLRGTRRQGAELACRSAVTGLHHKGDHWQIEAAGVSHEARIVINAGGAWADRVAELADVRQIGFQPYRRTIARVRVDPPAPATMPLVIDINGGFYFKPDTGGRIWLSPHDETPCAPCDAAPEELDIAIAIDRLSRVTNWKVEAVEQSWAGLRTFAPDRLPVFGFDSKVANFFWCAGQGGFGIQTAPAAARLCAELILGARAPADLAVVQTDRYSPARFD